MKKYIIIVAGGSGSRMGADIPKQFLKIGERPILMHTLEAFDEIADIEKIVVLPEAQVTYWEELCETYHFSVAHRVVYGGETRFHSVRNGLLSIIDEEHALVAVHDGVRPFISKKMIEAGYYGAASMGAVVTAVELKDSLRENVDGYFTARDRANYKLVQTPQTFRIDWMKKAFNVPYQPFFTDCASVVEYAGYGIELIEGAYENIKITSPDDLIFAEAILKSRATNSC